MFERLKSFFSSPEGRESLRLGLGVGVLSLTGVISLWAFSLTGRPLAPRPTKPMAPVTETGLPLHTATGQFNHGQRLFNILHAAALPQTKALSVVQSLTSVLDPRSLTETDRYELVHSTAGDFARLSIVRKLERFVVETAPTGLVARKETLPLEVSEKNLSGVLDDSLWGSMSAAGMDPAVILAYSDIFAWNVDFLTEPRQGDRYALSWKESRTPEGKLAQVTILAAIYDGKETGRHSATLFAGEYYENNGTSLRKAFLHAPLNFRRISSGFTNRRFHPILRTWRAHHGTDYAAPIGTPVVSVGDGAVIFRKWGGGLGNLIKVRHNGTYTTFYGHLSRFAGGISVGSHVRQGQIIGYVGSTGFSTGPHLHFQIMKNGSLVNFLTLKMPAVGSVPSGRKKAFEEKRDQIQPALEKLLPAPTA